MMEGLRATMAPEPWGGPMELSEWRGVPLPANVWAGVREIYRASFPTAERMDEDALRGSIKTGRRTLWTLGDVLGFAIGMDLAAAPPWMFCEYFAIRQDARSGGLGGFMLGALRDRGRPIVLEVEDPAWAGEMAARRVGFYERHGARRIPGTESYRAPNLERSGQALPMWLLQLGGEGGRGERAVSDVDALGSTLMRAILAEGYGLAPDALARHGAPAG